MDSNKLMNVTQETKKLADIFKQKQNMEEIIANLIKDYEAETGLRIDKIRLFRLDTMRIRDGIYTELTINIS